MSLYMVVARDYRTHSQFEYVIYENERVVARLGFFKSYSTAKRAGQRKAQDIYSERDAIEPPLPFHEAT